MGIELGRVHFRLTDEGELELQGWSEAAENEIFEKAHLLLERAIIDAPGDFDPEKPEGKALVKEAVARERKRVRAKSVAETKTGLGQEFKSHRGAPTSLIDRIVRDEGRKVLKKFRSKGKPN